MAPTLEDMDDTLIAPPPTSAPRARGPGVTAEGFERGETRAPRATDGGCCVLEPGCKLHVMLRDARESFYQSLDRQTLADCVGVRGQEAKRKITEPKSPRRSPVVKS